MNFLFRSSRKSKNDGASKVAVDDDATDTTGATSMPKRPSSSTSKNKPLKKTVNTELVEKWFELLNKHDVEGYVRLATPDCDLRFANGAAIAIKDYASAGDIVIASFPDFHFAGEPAREIKPGVVIVKNAVATGTHTGEPYAFAHYPPLFPTGVKCTTSPCDATFWITDGKIAKIHMFSSGKYIGMAGFYQLVKEAQQK